MVLSTAQTAQVSCPRILIGAMINVTSILLPFFLPFAAIRFVILLRESCFVAILIIYGE